MLRQKLDTEMNEEFFRACVRAGFFEIISTEITSLKYLMKDLVSENTRVLFSRVVSEVSDVSTKDKKADKEHKE